jgi:hypothetical protein
MDDESYLIKEQNLPIFILDVTREFFDLIDIAAFIEKNPDIMQLLIAEVKEIFEEKEVGVFLFTRKDIESFVDKVIPVLIDYTLWRMMKEDKVDVGLDENGEFIFSLPKKENK